MTLSEPTDVLERCTGAALALAAEQPWGEVSLRLIAERAEVPLPDLYAKAPTKGLLLFRIGLTFDRAALATAATPSDDVHDRLFDAAMARVEAMEPHRTALISIARGGGMPAILSRLARTNNGIRRSMNTAIWSPQVISSRK